MQLPLHASLCRIAPICHPQAPCTPARNKKSWNKCDELWMAGFCNKSCFDCNTQRSTICQTTEVTPWWLHAKSVMMSHDSVVMVQVPKCTQVCTHVTDQVGVSL